MTRSKVVDLADALRAAVRPHSTVHLSSVAVAAVFELLRGFRDTPLHLRLVARGVHPLTLLLANAGHVDRLLTTSVNSAGGGGSELNLLEPDGGPPVAVEFWSFFSLCQRYMAGAMGLPFLPTHSLQGSALATDLAGDFAEVVDPFGSGGRVGVVRQLRPDVAIVGALVADEQGNCIPVPHQGEDVWAAKASRQNAIVLAERIVSAEELRRSAPLVKIPGHSVRAVCECPYFAHPLRLFDWSFAGVGGYVQDAAFLKSFTTAVRSGPDDLRAWQDSWVYGSGSHQQYLDLVGRAHLSGLRERAGRPTARHSASRRGSVESREQMLVAAARRVSRVVRRSGSTVIIAGRGTSALVAFTGYRLLKGDTDEQVSLALGGGSLGFEPFSSDMSDFEHLRTARVLGDAWDVYGTYLRRYDAPAVAVIGFSQIDKQANINTTRGPDGRLLSGPGGGNDCAAGATELVVVGAMTPDRLTAKLEHLTSPGERVRTVVTDLGVLEKPPGQDELVLTTYFPRDGMSPEQVLSAIRSSCGWELAIADDVRAEEAPTEAERSMLLSLAG